MIGFTFEFGVCQDDFFDFGIFVFESEFSISDSNTAWRSFFDDAQLMAKNATILKMNKEIVRCMMDIFYRNEFIFSGTS